MALRPNQPHPIAQRFPRTTGFVVLLVGFAFFYISIVEPILHANVGEVIKLSGKGGLGGGIFIILGLLVMLFGPRALALGQTKAANSQKFALILGGVFAVVGIVAMEITKSYLRGKGYILP
ncbi:hypothetical protein SKTS_28770 [Sulfurimicrobium lacus]|uniref:Uncharacterized protein n=1 Tax=Sulfurimicrobium lacus TaxID=2715678 RepID=A0A6F8VFQ9_9PROT|nr:hypothetical protein [Sulfurimicrobium lacus]BCB27991.1 hypothetical protein SKTS_28770 [Sulfurimicrobium lacus]